MQVFKSIFRLILQNMQRLVVREKLNQVNFDQPGTQIW